jgi:hypothetical protein
MRLWSVNFSPIGWTPHKLSLLSAMPEAAHRGSNLSGENALGVRVLLVLHKRTRGLVINVRFNKPVRETLFPGELKLRTGE